MEALSYAELKLGMEKLCQERIVLTEKLHQVQKGNPGQTETNGNNNDVDELDAFMETNASSLKAETIQRIVSRLSTIKDEISKTSHLLSLVAPIDLSKQKAEIDV